MGIPAVVNKRLSGYVSGHQQFDYPVHTLKVTDGLTTITVAPGSQTGGLFSGVGRLDPHTYRPNEFFANNWVYEGLVEYGPMGSILPALAASWTVTESVDPNDPGQVFTFTLRQGVKFHDGSDWNCPVAKLNFDHVLAKPHVDQNHNWYNMPGAIKEWSCRTDFEFVVTTKAPYYPLLQELSYIRPLRMLSPKMFVGGLASDPLTQNSCHVGWGTVKSKDGSVELTCEGTRGVSGTGRWKYIETKKDGDKVEEVVFERNSDHWGPAGVGDVEKLRLVAYEDSAAVKAALLDKSLDVVVGSGVLDPADIAKIKKDNTQDFQVYLTEPLQNRIVILNAAKKPTDDLKVRKRIIHAVNKQQIIDKELFGLADPVYNMFPRSAPYCDLDLTPKWDFDLDKAKSDCSEDVSGVGQTMPSRFSLAIVLLLGLYCI